jgi:uncharacterized protein YjiS (DUF1127 family)
MNNVFLIHKTFDNERMSAAVYNMIQKAEGIPSVVNGWINRYRARKQLANLPEYLLKDIGLNKHDVEAEINKPFWR